MNDYFIISCIKNRKPKFSVGEYVFVTDDNSYFRNMFGTIARIDLRENGHIAYNIMFIPGIINASMFSECFLAHYNIH